MSKEIITSPILLTSNCRPEYRKAGFLANSASQGTYMVFSYAPKHIAPDVSLTVGDIVCVAMLPIDDSDGYFIVHDDAEIMGLDYNDSRLHIVLQFNSEYNEVDFDEPVLHKLPEYGRDGYVLFNDGYGLME